ncbi:MAG: hypothetical protein K8R39_06360 [Arcobacteraceae bacterium]|nr:hypothetical protein [Arcobacteraceae bacterium]
MKNKIKNLKQRIKDNYQELYDEYSDNCKLIKPTLEMIDLLLSVNASDEIIKEYLDKVSNAIKIVEEKLERVEKKKKHH